MSEKFTGFTYCIPRFPLPTYDFRLPVPKPSSKKLKKGKDEEQQVSDAAAQAEEPPRPPQVHLLRGMKDILPSEQPYWDRVRVLAEHLARSYGYLRIDTPFLEDASLFRRAVGADTDVVEKELFDFADKGGDAVSLRPEGTAGVVRAYVEHGMLNQPQPVKLWYLGPMFRYDRPQAGRLRQFHQFGLEVFGELHPATDAELLVLGANFFRLLGVPVIVQVNSIGCGVCRPRYVEELGTYIQANRTELCETCKERVQRGALLRVLDCQEGTCRACMEGAPQMVDWLCDECKQHFIRVLEYLDELEVPYALAPFLVRGLDYYTKTVFEFWPAAAVERPGGASAQVALAAGGRYDALVSGLGGRETPATGIAFGLERTILKMKEAVSDGRIATPAPYRPDVYLAQLGEQAKRRAMRLFEELRQHDVAVAATFAKDALKSQLEHANQLGATLTLILGQKEVIDGTIIIREMVSGIQEIIAYDKVLPEIRKRLAQEAVRQSTTTPTTTEPREDETRPSTRNEEEPLDRTDEPERSPDDMGESADGDGTGGDV